LSAPPIDLFVNVVDLVGILVFGMLSVRDGKPTGDVYFLAGRFRSRGYSIAPPVARRL
jgi:N-acyl-D-aspartate/D-glutamate deacylase